MGHKFYPNLVTSLLKVNSTVCLSKYLSLSFEGKYSILYNANQSTHHTFINTNCLVNYITILKNIVKVMIIIFHH